MSAYPYNAAMAQVTSLFASRLSEHPLTLDSAAVTLEIDFSDVRRVCAVREDGSPLLTQADPVVLGPHAHTQVRELFWHYGLRQIPSTWGQLTGNWDYCRGLHLSLISMNPEEPESTLKRLRTSHNRKQPGRGDVLWMLMNGDTEGVYAWHADHNTFEYNAQVQVRVTHAHRYLTA